MPIWESEIGKIYHGDAFEVLKQLPDESVHCCVTSPPYWGLRDYGLEPQIWDGDKDCEHVWEDNIPPRGQSGWYTFEHKYHSPGCHKTTLGSRLKKATEFQKNPGQGQFCQQCGAWRGCLGLEPTPELYVKHMVQIFAEVKRVLRNDGTLWLNMGDSYWGGKGKSSQAWSTKALDGRLKKGITLNQSQHQICSTGETRPQDGKHNILKPKDLIGIPWRIAFALQADGWYLRSDIIWAKPNPMPESVTDRPTKSHEYLFLLSKNQKYYYDADAIREPHKESSVDRAKYKEATRKSGVTIPQTDKRWNVNKMELYPTGRNKRTVWTIATKPMPEAHFATFPEKLIEPCILAGTSAKGCCVECGAHWERIVEKDTPEHYKGKQGRWGTDTGRMQMAEKFNTATKTIGWQPTCNCRNLVEPCTVLDPFIGAGTTFIVSYKNNRKCTGIDLSEPYLRDIAIPRIEKESKQLKLFSATQ